MPLFSSLFFFTRSRYPPLRSLRASLSWNYIIFTELIRSVNDWRLYTLVIQGKKPWNAGCLRCDVEEEALRPTFNRKSSETLHDGFFCTNWVEGFTWTRLFSGVLKEIPGRKGLRTRWNKSPRLWSGPPPTCTLGPDRLVERYGHRCHRSSPYAGLGPVSIESRPCKRPDPFPLRERP